MEQTSRPTPEADPTGRRKHSRPDGCDAGDFNVVPGTRFELPIFADLRKIMLVSGTRTLPANEWEGEASAEPFSRSVYLHHGSAGASPSQGKLCTARRSIMLELHLQDRQPPATTRKRYRAKRNHLSINGQKHSKNSLGEFGRVAVGFHTIDRPLPVRLACRNVSICRLAVQPDSIPCHESDKR